MNTLFRGIRVLMPDFTVAETDVYVAGDAIAALGQAPEGFTADTVVEGKNRLLLPGFVNAHTHVYMSMFRGCADDLPFADWLMGHIDPLEARMTREDCYWASQLGYLEMLSTGTTCSLDMYVFTESAVRAAQESGVRAALCRGLTGPEDGERRIREATEEIRAWRGKEDRLRFFLGPHAPYTCSEAYLRQVAELSEELGLSMNIHISESLFEQETIRSRYGCTPSEYLDRAGILKPGTVAAHCVYLSDTDIALLAQRQVSVVTNPVSNMKLGNGFAPIPRLQKAGVNICLGTDGAASNNALNLFRDLSLLTLLHKGLGGDPTLVTAREGLRMATVGGAKALGLEGTVGIIAPGYQADLTVLDLDKPWLRPWCDIPSSLAYAANGSEVESVMVAGRFLMKDGEFLTIDRERVLFEVDRTCRRLGILK